MSDHESVLFNANLSPIRNRKPPYKVKVFRYKSAHRDKPKDGIAYIMTNTDKGVTDIDNTPETEKDFGVTFDRLFKFHQHISTVVEKNQMLGLIKHIDCIIFWLLYTVLVRPHIDYADSI